MKFSQLSRRDQPKTRLLFVSLSHSRAVNNQTQRSKRVFYYYSIRSEIRIINSYFTPNLIREALPFIPLIPMHPALEYSQITFS